PRQRNARAVRRRRARRRDDRPAAAAPRPVAHRGACAGGRGPGAPRRAHHAPPVARAGAGARPRGGGAAVPQPGGARVWHGRRRSHPQLDPLHLGFAGGRPRVRGPARRAAGRGGAGVV
ncbi:MAG: hypothetical protein ACK56F_16845, partial [bacterium]